MGAYNKRVCAPLIKSCNNGKLGKKGSCRVFSLTQVVLQFCEVLKQFKAKLCAVPECLKKKKPWGVACLKDASRGMLEGL